MVTSRRRELSSGEHPNLCCNCSRSLVPSPSPLAPFVARPAENNARCLFRPAAVATVECHRLLPDLDPIRPKANVRAAEMKMVPPAALEAGAAPFVLAHRRPPRHSMPWNQASYQVRTALLWGGFMRRINIL